MDEPRACPVRIVLLLGFFFGRVGSYLPNQGSNPCHGSIESWPLGCWGSPCNIILNEVSHLLLLLAKSLQSCPTLCDPIDGSPPGSPVPEILQASTLEWVAFSFSNAWKWKVKVKSLSHVRLFATPWTAAYQAPLPMGFSRQEYWSGLPLPSPQVGSN